MKKNYIEDILSLHADQLITEQQTQRAENGKTSNLLHDWLALPDPLNDKSVPSSENLVDLFNLAREVQTTLSPVSPSSHFQAKLKQELLTAARSRQAPQDSSRELLIFTALLGFLVSVAGLFVARRWRGQVTFAPF